MKKLLYLLILIFITLCFNGCGWGWLVPYSVQPSYWKFKKMCKLNELPNNEYKYNKILKYFNTDLESLDWDKLNEKTWKIQETNGDYKKGIFEYATLTEEKQLNSRAGIIARLLSNESPISKYNTNQMSIDVSWHTRRYYLSGNEGSGFYWSEETLACVDVAKENMTPRE